MSFTSIDQKLLNQETSLLKTIIEYEELNKNNILANIKYYKKERNILLGVLVLATIGGIGSLLTSLIFSIQKSSEDERNWKLLCISGIILTGIASFFAFQLLSTYFTPLLANLQIRKNKLKKRIKSINTLKNIPFEKRTSAEYLDHLMNEEILYNKEARDNIYLLESNIQLHPYDNDRYTLVLKNDQSHYTLYTTNIEKTDLEKHYKEKKSFEINLIEANKEFFGEQIALQVKIKDKIPYYQTSIENIRLISKRDETTLEQNIEQYYACINNLLSSSVNNKLPRVESIIPL
jgi:hypothetical protein